MGQITGTSWNFSHAFRKVRCFEPPIWKVRNGPQDKQPDGNSDDNIKCFLTLRFLWTWAVFPWSQRTFLSLDLNSQTHVSGVVVFTLLLKESHEIVLDSSQMSLVSEDTRLFYPITCCSLREWSLLKICIGQRWFLTISWYISFFLFYILFSKIPTPFFRI